MKKNDIITDIYIEKLVFWWKGFGRSPDGKVIFITGGAVPQAVVHLRIIKKKRDYYEAQITKVVKKSPLETWNYEVIPGTPWINIEYSEQLKIKEAQIKEALFHCKKYQAHIPFLPIIGMRNTFWYRNKIEFSFWKYISHREEIFQDFNIWFHKQGDFSRVLDFKSCSLIDDEQNQIYNEIRRFTKNSGYSVHDQKIWTGFWRHFMMRKMHFSGETLLVFSVHPWYFRAETAYREAAYQIEDFVENILSKKYRSIKSVYISRNANLSDTLIWDLELIYGKDSIQESLLWYSFDIGPKSFFQTNSVWAEILYSLVKDFAHIPKDWSTLWIVLDLYAGTWTIGMIFSDISQKVISVELVSEASKSWQVNADKNGVKNMEFMNKKVEVFLEEYLEKWNTADLLIIDPPRAGMHPSALPDVLKFNTKQIIYVSCNPATLGRDLEYILTHSDYTIEKVQAVDMFPHTHHIETVVSLIKKTEA